MQDPSSNPHKRLHPKMKALVKNASVILGGNMFSALFSLAYMAILTRALSLDHFGIYSLMIAYVAIITRLSSFQSWQGLIHFGAHIKDENKPVLFYNLFVFGWSLELLSGIVGFSIALLIASLAPQWIGISQRPLIEIGIICLPLLFNWISVPTAYFRLQQKFLPQATYQNIIVALHLIGFTGLWAFKVHTLLPYLVVSAASSVTGQLWFFIYCISDAKKHGYSHFDYNQFKAIPTHCPGIWRYMLTTNLDGIVRVGRDLDIFIVNAILNVQATALYKIAKTLTTAMGKITGPFFQAIYPELARMVAKKEFGQMLGLMKQSSILLGSVTLTAWILFALIGEKLISIAFGALYINAYEVSLWSMAAMVVWGCAQPLSPAMMALGKTSITLYIHLTTTISYLIALLLLCQTFGLTGAGISLFAFYIAWSLTMLAFTLISIRHAIALNLFERNKID
jgi:O-antigen/teichoic acid export membrane protein